MEKGFKTHLLIGALGAAVLGVGAYGLYLESHRRAAQPPAVPSPGQAPAETQGGASLRIETLSAVAPDASGLEAHVIGAPGLQFEWSIQGGKLESGNQRETLQWAAGSSGEVVLTCRAFDAAGAETSTSLRIPIQPVPTIAIFEAAPKVLTLGGSAKLGWTVKDGRKVVLDPGGRDVTAMAGPGLEVKPTETTTYTLTATHASGTTASREVTVRVLPAPEVLSLRAEPRSGGSFSVIGEFKGGKAELKAGGVLLASGDSSPLTAELAGQKPGSSVSLVVTNEAGSSATGTVTFAVQK